MKLGIYANKYKDKDFRITEYAMSELKKCGIDILLHDSLHDVFPRETVFTESGGVIPDILLTIGGDGTILRIAGYCAKNSVPILGINLGLLGFLTEVEVADIKTIAENIKSGEFTTEDRAMIEIDAFGKKFTALNELVVSRETGDRMLHLNLFIDGEFVDKYYSDGFIVATPTGSTAYSLSAGGPIVAPGCGVFALTPISSHSLHSRALISSDSSVVKIELGSGNAERASVIVDGNSVGRIEPGDSVSVRKSDKKASFVRFSGSGFYSKLLTKLNSWSVTK